MNVAGGGDRGTRRCTMQAADMMGLQFDRPTGGSARTNRLRTPGLSSVRTGNGQATSTSTATLMSLLPEDAEGDVGISDERGVPSSEDLQRMTLVGPSSGSQWNSEAVAAGAAAQLLSGIEAVSRFGGAIGKVTSVARISNLALFGAGKNVHNADVRFGAAIGAWQGVHEEGQDQLQRAQAVARHHDVFFTRACFISFYFLLPCLTRFFSVSMFVAW